jgi:cell division inhibitor SulA
MPKFVIERDLPGAGSLSAEQLQVISAKSNSVLNELGPEVRWIQSYIAPSADLIREHASRGGFPANAINEVKTVIDPTTGEAAQRA